MVVSEANGLVIGRNKMTESILNLTLEIIYLLTGEDCIVVKKTSGECVASTGHHYVSELWHRNKTLFRESLIDMRSNDQKIRDLANTIIHLLTGEVPIRCEDVAIYFSMEEWEYVEEHKDQYKDVMVEDHQPLTSGDESIPEAIPARYHSPHHSHYTPEENHDVSMSCQSEEMNNEKATYIEESHMYLWTDQQCKDEILHVEPSPDDRVIVSEGHPLFSDYEAEPGEISYNTFPNNFITTDIPLVFHNRNLSSDLVGHQEPSSDQSQIANQDSSHREDKILTFSEFGRPYKTSSKFSTHMKMHRNERLFACLQCEKRFTRKWSLVEHQRIHTGERPFSCLKCGKSFSRKSILVEHQKSHTGEKPFLCLKCGKRFIAKQHLARHQITHTGERPFLCSECGRCFNRKWLLERHLRTHIEWNQFSDSK
ncbi:uncharacterized protein ACNLHF_020595 isoform 1-T3 [Anomaloglossus baeobatrachus]|uniref:uncharacterized protein LOC142311132 n=1 Tax=Anomaloglossus baeobatrachus TaxID=238106 RepID=UPI003F500820